MRTRRGCSRIVLHSREQYIADPGRAGRAYMNSVLLSTTPHCSSLRLRFLASLIVCSNVLARCTMAFRLLPRARILSNLQRHIIPTTARTNLLTNFHAQSRCFSATPSARLMEMSGFTESQLDVREAIEKICANYPDVHLSS